MSARFKIAIRWADGTVLGLACDAASEELAKSDVYKKIYELSVKRGSFSLIKDLDIFTLPDDEINKIKSDWDLALTSHPIYGWP